jgi:phage terminase large subunit-like protein
VGSINRLDWGPARAERNIKWIEANCYIPDGKDVGKPVRLRDWQKKEIRKIYTTPTRRIIISFGRKNAKTTLSAFLLLLHTVGPEAKINSQLYSAAQSRDQAAILFSLAAKVVRMSPTLSQYVIVRDTAKQLLCKELGTVYKALSAEVSTSYGLSSAFTVHDELGQVKGPHSALYEALETSSGAHDEPLTIVISTQAPTDGDLLSILIDDALAGHDPKIKVSLYTADESIDPFSEEAIRQANPAFGDFLNADEILEKANAAKRMPSSESSYRNLTLNQRVEANDPFVSKTIWQANGDFPSELTGLDVYGGLDLSSVADLTSLELTAWNEDKVDVHSTFWLPGDNIIEKSKKDRVPYDLWADQGFLELTPGPSIEYEYIAIRLRDVFDNCNVMALSFDRWNMRHLKPWLLKAGFTEEELEKFISFGQGYQSMSPALRDLEALLLNNKIRHGNHPVLSMCAANARIQKDPAGNRKFTKEKSSGRIDGMVALAMAIGAMPEENEGDYASGRLISL